jgi:hypothetical protein
VAYTKASKTSSDLTTKLSRFHEIAVHLKGSKTYLVSLFDKSNMWMEKESTQHG